MSQVALLKMEIDEHNESANQYDQLAREALRVYSLSDLQLMLTRLWGQRGIASIGAKAAFYTYLKQQFKKDIFLEFGFKAPPQLDPLDSDKTQSILWFFCAEYPKT